ncbi:MAG: hypothetical protein JXR76_25770 [Deltaproteobacteria bacterium]|nr:hypothetical protein [Deltaproteobacteria bacterium]
MNTNQYLVSAILLWVGVLFAGNATAQLPGQYINPNVTILLDTGRGMNWTKPQSPDSYNATADQRTRDAEAQCYKMNEMEDYGSLSTSWQMVMEALMGTIPAHYQHCFYEEAVIRPMLKADTLSGIPGDADTDTAGNSMYEDISKLTAEYWEYSREPHFRLVNCRDPRSSESGGGRGDWNEDFQQCIGNLPSVSGLGVQFSTMSGQRRWCKNEDHVEVVDKNNPNNTRHICFDYHPLALDRSTDGILERFRTLGRFNLMSFDNLPAPTQKTWNAASKNFTSAEWDLSSDYLDIHRSGWDYGVDTRWFITAYEQRNPADPDSYYNVVPTGSASKYWNAGVRGPYPQAVGRMIPISNDFENSNHDARVMLNSVEPNHCSFDAAMFDDAGEYYYNSPEVRPAYNQGSDFFYDCRPKVAFFITDGIQTDSLEFPQAYCSKDKTLNSTTSLAETLMNGAPPAPWTATGDDAYNCPFNSTATEVEQMYQVVSKLAANPASVEPLYLVVIGVNMKGKDSDVRNRCDIDPDNFPGWQTDTVSGEAYCPKPADDCIVLRELSEAECKADVETANDQVWVTPRQYLNLLALKGWPEKKDAVLYGESVFREAPWRERDDSGVLVNDWCERDKDEFDRFNNCGGEHEDKKANGALFVNSAEDLSMVISMVLQSISPETVSSRTEVVTAINPEFGVENTSIAAQWVMNSGYQTSGDGPWKGYLYREGQLCKDETATDTDSDTSAEIVNNVTAFHDLLTSQIEDEGRSLYVVKPDVTDKELEYDGSKATFQLGLPDVLTEFKSGEVYDNDLGLAESEAETSTEYAKMVAVYLYPDSTALTDTPSIGPRAEHPMGDIYSSTPFVLPPANERVPYASYQEYRASTFTADGAGEKKTLSERKPLLYVGTNDGILHSFNLMYDPTKTDSFKPEGWGFIPSALLPTIGTQFPIGIKRTNTLVDGDYTSDYEVEAGVGGYQHIFGVDGPPVAADVLLYRKLDSPENELKYWRSIVVGGLGKGGYGYFALDVTETPEHRPVFRWELSPDRFGTNASRYPPDGEDPTSEAAQVRRMFGEMGMGLARPELAYVYMKGPLPIEKATSAEHQVAVAILPGGYKAGENGGLGVSTGVYIVRLGDGKLLRYLNPTVDADVDLTDTSLFISPLFNGDIARARVAQLIGQPVVPNSIKTGKVADQAFIGDDRGRIWQIDLSSTDPSEWKLKLFFDTLLAEHYPYYDCLSDSAPGAAKSKSKGCCGAKDIDVSLPCSLDEQKAMFSGTLTKSDLGMNACTGQACVNKEFPFPRIPMLAPPTVVQDDELNNVLLFGTGQIDGMENLDHHRVYSITQTPLIEVVESGGATTSTLNMAPPKINWWIGEPIVAGDLPFTISANSGLLPYQMQMVEETSTNATDARKAEGQVTAVDGYEFFGLGEKLLGRIFVFDKVAYFSTFVPLSESSTNACGDGGSKIWGVNYNTLNEVDSSNQLTGVFNKMEVEGEDALQPFMVYDGTVLTGLKLVRNPPCGGREGFTLMAQTRAMDPDSGAPLPPNSTKPQISTISVPLPVPARGFTRVGIDSWSIVM